MKFMDLLFESIVESAIHGIIQEEGEQAREQAHKLGLVSVGWGRWADPKTGQVVAKTIQGNLVKVDPESNVQSDDEYEANMGSMLDRNTADVRMVAKYGRDIDLTNGAADNQYTNPEEFEKLQAKRKTDYTHTDPNPEHLSGVVPLSGKFPKDNGLSTHDMKKARHFDRKMMAGRMAGNPDWNIKQGLRAPTTKQSSAITPLVDYEKRALDRLVKKHGARRVNMALSSLNGHSNDNIRTKSRRFQHGLDHKLLQPSP